MTADMSAFSPSKDSHRAPFFRRALGALPPSVSNTIALVDRRISETAIPVEESTENLPVSKRSPACNVLASLVSINVKPRFSGNNTIPTPTARARNLGGPSGGRRDQTDTALEMSGRDDTSAGPFDIDTIREIDRPTLASNVTSRRSPDSAHNDVPDIERLRHALVRSPVSYLEECERGTINIQDEIIGEIVITGNDYTWGTRRAFTISAIVALDNSSGRKKAISSAAESQFMRDNIGWNQAFTSLPTCFLNRNCRNRKLILSTRYSKRSADNVECLGLRKQFAKSNTPGIFVLDIAANFSVGVYREQLNFGRDPSIIVALESSLSPSNFPTFLAAVWDRQTSLDTLSYQLKGVGEAIWSLIESLSIPCHWPAGSPQPSIYYSPSISLLSISLLGSQASSEDEVGPCSACLAS
ncbi:hypothetical protein FS749_003004 [Ceratobasidium sp. UAMH 11750]|nr:hypothetical protein FS749_003004 [Ceratobasidium sp. UAMH 11750]